MKFRSLNHISCINTICCHAKAFRRKHLWNRMEPSEEKTNERKNKRGNNKENTSLHIVYYENGASLIILAGTYLPSFGAFPWEFSENNLFFRMLFLVFFATCLNEECIRCHASSGLTIGVFSTSHFCGWIGLLDLLQMLIILIILLMILLDLLMFLYMLILKKMKKKIEHKLKIQGNFWNKKTNEEQFSNKNHSMPINWIVNN